MTVQVNNVIVPPLHISATTRVEEERRFQVWVNARDNCECHLEPSQKNVDQGESQRDGVEAPHEFGQQNSWDAAFGEEG